MDPLVVKIGGSLLGSVPDLVQVIRQFPHAPLLLVPGGGPFADQVRHLNLPEEEAHWMAIAAMEQCGRYIASQGLDSTDILRIPSSPCVLLPYRMMRDHDPLPHTWEITSDTIAAWVAASLQSDLLLLKSVDGLFQQGLFRDRISEVFPCQEVDPAFLPFLLSHQVRCTVLNGSIPSRLEDFLRGAPVRGTRVETTF
jgi:aspartokinase-like uncharacterized kinase